MTKELLKIEIKTNVVNLQLVREAERRHLFQARKLSGRPVYEHIFVDEEGLPVKTPDDEDLIECYQSLSKKHDLPEELPEGLKGQDRKVAAQEMLAEYEAVHGVTWQPTVIPLEDRARRFKLPPDVENTESYRDEAYEKYWNLHTARTQKLRREQRYRYLAYAFLRDVPYEIAEAAGTYSIPDFTYIEHFSRQHWEHGDNLFTAKFSDWRAAAERALDGKFLLKHEIPTAEVA